MVSSFAKERPYFMRIITKIFFQSVRFCRGRYSNFYFFGCVDAVLQVDWRENECDATSLHTGCGG